MAENRPPVHLGRLRPITTIALAVLLVAWTSWKLYKLEFLWRYGFFSWQFMGATLVGALVFLASLGVIFWTFERHSWRGQ